MSPALEAALRERHGERDEAIAASLGVSEATVRRARKALELPAQPPPPGGGRHPNRPSPEALSRARAELLEGASLRVAAERSGLSVGQCERLRLELRAELGEGAVPGARRGRPRKDRLVEAFSSAEIAKLDERAAREGVTRAELVRRLLGISA